MSVYLKVYEYTIRGSNCLLQIYLPSQEEFTLTGKNFFLLEHILAPLLLEQIIFFKSKPRFGGAMSTRGTNRKSLSYSP